MNDYFEIFRTGLHTDSNGKQKDWSEEDLNAIAARYNEQKDHEAPLVIGHPETNHPAYGWVEKLKVEGGKLLAKAAQIVPEFAKAIKTGLFKKRSISLYPDLLLRHVGFLGAVPPAVKGLKDIAFSTTEEAEITEYETADCTETPADYNEIVTENAALKSDLAEKELKLADLTDEMNQKADQYFELDAKYTKLQKEFSEFKKVEEQREFKRILHDKVISKAITPAQAEMIQSYYADIDRMDLAAINFAEGKSPKDFIKNFIQTIPRLLPETPNIPTTEPEIVPIDAVELAAKAVEFVEEQEKKGITIPYHEAVQIVKPQLLNPKQKE